MIWLAWLGMFTVLVLLWVLVERGVDRGAVSTDTLFLGLVAVGFLLAVGWLAVHL